jgi:phosphoribosylformylglycinamidine synthase
MEAARNVVCSGGKPLAITNCLNFGNPYKPELYWVFKEAVGGMGDACRRLDTPVTGGNVSFYNENVKSAVFPTPTIGMLGLVEDLSHITPSAWSEGQTVYYIGADRKGFDGSEYLSAIHGLTMGDAPSLDMDFEANLQDALLKAIQSGLIGAAHDVSDGGLGVTLAEMAIFSGIGAQLLLPGLGASSAHETLFSEAQSGVVIGVDAVRAAEVEAHFKGAGVPIHKLGSVGGSSLIVDGVAEWEVGQLDDRYQQAIPDMMSAAIVH